MCVQLAVSDKIKFQRKLGYNPVLYMVFHTKSSLLPWIKSYILDDGITVREACADVHSPASWLSGRAYANGGREKVVKIVSSLNCDRARDRKEEIMCIKKWRK
jgi:hypothetical protein